MESAKSRINGPAADNWAAGVVCFEMLTGDLPFWPDSNAVLPAAPDHVPEDSKKEWQKIQAVLKLQSDWVGPGCSVYPVCLSQFQSAQFLLSLTNSLAISIKVAVLPVRGM